MTGISHDRCVDDKLHTPDLISLVRFSKSGTTPSYFHRRSLYVFTSSKHFVVYRSKQTEECWPLRVSTGNSRCWYHNVWMKRPCVSSTWQPRTLRRSPHVWSRLQLDRESEARQPDRGSDYISWVLCIPCQPSFVLIVRPLKGNTWILSSRFSVHTLTKGVD